MQTFDGKVVVVTGAASGIGLALVKGFAADGARVVMADFDRARLAEEAGRVRATGAEVIDRVTDVGYPAAIDALASASMDAYGRVDVICNNAGTIAFGTAWEMSAEDWDRVLRVNLMAVIHGIRAFVPLLRASGDDGHVVNTASMAAFMKLGSVPPYVTTKHAVVGLSEALAEDLKQVGSAITVTVACPGMVSTRFGQPDADLAPEDQLPEGVVSARSAAASIRHAMAERRLYAFTHPDSEQDIQARHDRIIRSFRTG